MCRGARCSSVTLDQARRGGNDRPFQAKPGCVTSIRSGGPAVTELVGCPLRLRLRLSDKNSDLSACAGRVNPKRSSLPTSKPARAPPRRGRRLVILPAHSTAWGMALERLCGLPPHHRDLPWKKQLCRLGGHRQHPRPKRAGKGHLPWISVFFVPTLPHLCHEGHVAAAVL